MSQTNYLTGSYNDEWNANLSSMEAASIVSLSTAVAYTVPFVGGILADNYLGDYKTILMGVCCFYLPGLFVIASSTFPNWWLGYTSFNVTAYKFALLFLWPIGTGTIKAVVNVFGARQYHPILQRSLVESYYVQFYMVINVGAVVGCIVIPVVARTSITMAYSIPFVLLFSALLVFVAGSTRYVDMIPLGRASTQHQEQLHCNQETDHRESNEREKEPTFSDVAKICALIIPFNIVYGQCPTTCKSTINVLSSQLLVLAETYAFIIHSIHVSHSHGPGSSHGAVPWVYRSTIDGYFRLCERFGMRILCEQLLLSVSEFWLHLIDTCSVSALMTSPPHLLVHCKHNLAGY